MLVMKPILAGVAVVLAFYLFQILLQKFNDYEDRQRQIAQYEYIYNKVAKYQPDHAPRITDVILYVAPKYNLPPELVAVVCEVESEFDMWAISSAGAMGLMQVIPEMHTNELRLVDDGKLWREIKRRGIWKVSRMKRYYQRIYYGVELGCIYLRELLDRFDEDYAMALVGYSHGPNIKGLNAHVLDCPYLAKCADRYDVPVQPPRQIQNRVWDFLCNMWAST